MTSFRQLIFIGIFSGVAAEVVAQDRPLALVEYVDAPEAEVVEFDYVYENDKFDLRPDGELQLAYFDRCAVETFTGGVVKLKEDEAKISKGGESQIEAHPCQTASLVLSEEAREAGVSVKRVSPFPEDEWKEFSVAVAAPRFVWPKNKKAKTNALVSVYLLEAEPAELVWQGEADASFIVYPEEAPALEPGLPYEAVVTYGGKKATSVVFSIDPGLELPDSPLTTTVPLGL